MKQNGRRKALVLFGESETWFNNCDSPRTLTGIPAARHDVLRHMTYHVMVDHMIRSFADKEAGKIWEGTPSRRVPADIQNVARRKLRMLNNAATLDDLRIPPANRLEALKGSRKGQHSIRINDQWRICFHWNDGDAHDVEIIDYH